MSSFPILQFEKEDGGEEKGQDLQNMCVMVLKSLCVGWEEREQVEEVAQG